MIPTSRGFIAGGEGGSVVIYEKIDDTSHGQMIPAAGVGLTPTMKTDVYRKARDMNVQDEQCKITNLTLTQNEDLLICTSDKCQIFSVALAGTDMKASQTLSNLITRRRIYNLRLLLNLSIMDR